MGEDMKIGIGTKIAEGKFQFNVAAPCLPALQLTMERFESSVEKAPRYRFFYGGENCGAMWWRTTKDGGVDYLQGHIESPVFPDGKLQVAAFSSKENPGNEMDLVWSPREDRRGDGI